MASVVSGDFTKNSEVKLSKHEGGIVFLELSTGLMKSESYNLNKTQSVTSEGQVGKNTLLKINFEDGKWVMLLAEAKDAEEIISACKKPKKGKNWWI